MIDMSKARCNHSDDAFCINDTEECKFERTTLKTFLCEPWPEVLNLSISWLDTYVNRTGLATLYQSISEEFRLDDLFNLRTSTDSTQDTPPAPIYRIKAVVCFIGAHYISFVKKKGGAGGWRLYNDEQSFPVGGWNDVKKRMAS